MRILRSYAEGEAVTIEVLRKQKRQAVSWTVPQRESRLDRMFRREGRDPTGLRRTGQDA
jgi:hypothetical protein